MHASVDFPAPEEPRRSTTSPGRTVMDAPRSTDRAAAPSAA